MTARTQYFPGAALMLLDAVLYSIGAWGPLRAALNPAGPYWRKRLLLNLLLAYAGLYFTGPFALDGAYLAGSRGNASLHHRHE
jgi:hypothetical protein